MTGGERLRAERIRVGLSVSELARQSGVSKGYISQIENGHVHSPSASKMTALARAIRCPLQNLLEESLPVPDTRLQRYGASRGWGSMEVAMLSTIVVDGVPVDEEPEEDWDAILAAIRDTVRKRRARRR